MFKITDNKGFHLSFDNGITVSVQFGRGNYCDNYTVGGWEGPVEPSSNAEVMVWDREGKTLPIPSAEGEIPENADVVGYQSANDVARIINHFARQGARS